ncbi:hypothetical protein [Leptolyngbya sp. O-77]|uniref:hypothetical protein n=1 Tax=Leptolyngbya sp. O-77 TaxID=1080068 RepID=UPI0012E333FE|nr:hypothetical protein [Leptolyngbya sp. O-77]
MGQITADCAGAKTPPKTPRLAVRHCAPWKNPEGDCSGIQADDVNRTRSGREIIPNAELIG